MSIIYYDQVIDQSGNPRNNTPAGIYIGVHNFASILDNIASGEIVTGTGTPYPVNWEDNPEDKLPWFPNGPNTGKFDPWEHN